MKLLVLDGNSIVNRAYYGIKLLTAKDGTPTNALYGFLTMLGKLLDETSPDAVAVAFDMKKPTFRHEKYSGYKAQRKGMPNELAAQMPILKQILTHLGYRIIECEGWEADDILGTLAAACGKSGDTCLIATGDRDSLQLVSDSVNVRLAATKMGKPEVTLYDVAKIREEYGLEPRLLIDVKALMGDSSDNIPGVAGIGQKGALELIKAYGTIDEIYDKLDTLDIKDGLRQKLIAGKESAFLSRWLGTVACDAPVDTSAEAYVPKPRDDEELSKLFTRLEFFSLMEKMGISKSSSVPQANKKEYSFCEVKNVNELMESEHFYFIYEDGILTVCDNDTVHFMENLSDNDLKLFFENDTPKSTYDCKTLYKSMLSKGIEVKNIVFDCMLAGYLLNPSASGYDMERLCREYGVYVPEFEHAQKFAAVLPELCKKSGEKIDEYNQRALLTDIEIPLSTVLSDMELEGFSADARGISEFGDSLGARIAEIESSIYEYTGENFNINSPKQLGEVLFEKLGLKGGKKTKTGYSTSADVLEKLKDEHSSIPLILEYRTLSKLKSTYCDGLVKVIGQDGRIHTNFNQTETRTGRISSTEPNLQNIPVRTELGRELRRFFVAKDGCVLCDADYSQIELRVLSHMANDKKMISAFNENADIHAITASEVFNMPLIMVTPLMRSRAKAVNFGIVYGIGAHSLSEDIGVAHYEAKRYIDSYLELYSGVRKFMESCKESAKANGYAETMFHRRRFLPELSSSNFNLRSFGERVAMNMPIQGTAADIIKIAMVRVYRRLKDEKLKSKLILQVHDELIVEAPDNEAERASTVLREEMENAIDMKVRLLAEVSRGRTWYDAKN